MSLKSLNNVASRMFVILLLLCAVATPALSRADHVGVSEAYELALRGDVVLIDVRHPSEWQQTGIGASVQPISMHQPGFLKKLNRLVKGNKSRPIALICATGKRSKRMQLELVRHGYKNVIDVDGGMMGTNTNPGWIETGLPTQKP